MNISAEVLCEMFHKLKQLFTALNSLLYSAMVDTETVYTLVP